MNGNHQEKGPSELVAELARALNEHDIDGLVECFAPDYVNETPAHPHRGFRGSDQVRRNWTSILAAVPDFRAAVVGEAVHGETVWSEWEHNGTRRDGSPHAMRGVVIFTVSAGLVRRARFYLEPVETSGGDIDAAIADLASRGNAPTQKEES